MKKIIFSLVTVLSLVVLFLSCSSGSDEYEKVVKIDSPIVGKWHLDSHYIEGDLGFPLPVNITFEKKASVSAEDFSLDIFGITWDMYEFGRACQEYISEFAEVIIRSLSFRKDGSISLVYNDNYNFFEIPHKYAEFSLLDDSQVAINVDADVIIQEWSVSRVDVKKVLREVFKSDLIVNFDIEDDKLHLSMDLDFLIPKLRQIDDLLHQDGLYVEKELRYILDQIYIGFKNLDSFVVTLHLKV